MLPVHNKIVKMVITIITWFQNTDFFQNSLLQISGVLFGVTFYLILKKAMTKWIFWSLGCRKSCFSFIRVFPFSYFIWWATYMQHIGLALSDLCSNLAMAVISVAYSMIWRFFNALFDQNVLLAYYYKLMHFDLY